MKTDKFVKYRIALLVASFTALFMADVYVQEFSYPSIGILRQKMLTL